MYSEDYYTPESTAREKKGEVLECMIGLFYHFCCMISII